MEAATKADLRTPKEIKSGRGGEYDEGEEEEEEEEEDKQWWMSMTDRIW